MRILLIAEIASQHFGDLEIAKRYIREASKAGATYAKFQYYDTDEIVSKDDPRYPKIKQAQLDLSQLAELRGYCHSHNLEFLCTPFLNPRKAEGLASIGCRELKIRERDSTNETLIRKSLEVCKTVFISTTKLPVGNMFLYYHPHIHWWLTIPRYPAKLEELDLSRIISFDGYSNHIPDIVAPLAAAAVAKEHGKSEFFIEVHVTLDHSIDNLDKSVSIDFRELAELVRHLRAIELMGKEEIY